MANQLAGPDIALGQLDYHFRTGPANFCRPMELPGRNTQFWIRP